jgi:hypothetical protein
VTTIWIVTAPLEGEGPEDTSSWSFATREEAEWFATEGGPDGGITNPWIDATVEPITVTDSYAAKVTARTKKAVGS